MDPKTDQADRIAGHYTEKPDFYTAGYSGRDISAFIALLQSEGIATLVDIRYDPVSRFKPEFSKNNLKTALEAGGIAYVHRRDWGVPREIRAGVKEKRTREELWAWYDSNVLPGIEKCLDELFNNLKQPVVLMCLERDPAECHRHRILIRLERLGFRGRDL